MRSFRLCGRHPRGTNKILSPSMRQTLVPTTGWLAGWMTDKKAEIRSIIRLQQYYVIFPSPTPTTSPLCCCCCCRRLSAVFHYCTTPSALVHGHPGAASDRVPPIPQQPLTISSSSRLLCSQIFISKHLLPYPIAACFV